MSMTIPGQYVEMTRTASKAINKGMTSRMTASIETSAISADMKRR
jgi:hypothetical protein